MKYFFCFFFSICFGKTVLAQSAHQVKNLKITILSTMLAQKGMGEWGFAALVEADSVKILFDAGSHERTVLENSKVLNIDLSQVPRFVISHNHWDHTIGWIPLRTEISRSNRQALSVTHVGQGIFDTRLPKKAKKKPKYSRMQPCMSDPAGRLLRMIPLQRSFRVFMLQDRWPENIPKRITTNAGRKKMQLVKRWPILCRKICR
eukprot:Opistho-2@54473